MWHLAAHLTDFNPVGTAVARWVECVDQRVHYSEETSTEQKGLWIMSTVGYLYTLQLLCRMSVVVL